MERREISRVHSTAPIRFDFAGGPTDVEPFRSRESGFVVNGALEKSAEVSITRRSDRRIVIRSDDLNQEESFDSVETMDTQGPLRLVKASVKHAFPSTGLEIQTKTDVPSGSGLGASAALAVALIGGLKVITGEVQPEAEQLVEDALYVENVMLNNINGGQDQYASALGGFHSFNFGPDRVRVNELNVKSETIAELEDRSVLCYSGESHISGNVLNQIMTNYVNGDATTIDALHSMKETAYRIEQALVKGDLSHFGELIQNVFEIQRNLHPDVVPQNIEKISSLALSHGALGGRIVGAGGGGCVYFFCEKGRREEVMAALQGQGLQIIPMKFTQKGIQVSYS